MSCRRLFGPFHFIIVPICPRSSVSATFVPVCLQELIRPQVFFLYVGRDKYGRWNHWSPKEVLKAVRGEFCVFPVWWGRHRRGQGVPLTSMHRNSRFCPKTHQALKICTAGRGTRRKSGVSCEVLFLHLTAVMCMRAHGLGSIGGHATSRSVA